MKLEKRSDTSGENEQPEKRNEKERYSRKREISVLIYTTILFVIAIALIALSYAIQERTNSRLSDLSEQHGEFSAQAMRNIEELQKENQELQNRLDAVEALNDLISCEDEGQRQKLIDRVEKLKDYLSEDNQELYRQLCEKDAESKK